MRAHIVLALVLVGGVALAADPAVRISPPPSLPLAGGTVTGQTTFTADPASTAVASTTLLANPATCAANEPLLGAAVAGSTRFSADCEGDVNVPGTLKTSGEYQSTATGSFFYINTTTPGLALRSTGAELYVSAVSPLYKTSTNCADNGGAAGCTAAPAGHVVVDDGATSVVVTSTAFGANTQCFPMFDASAGARLSVTCNTTFVSAYVSARSGTTQTWNISSDPAGTDPVCLGFFCVNR